MIAKNYTANDHSFIILAYGENPFLETAIESIVRQRVLGKVVMATSTNTNMIRDLSQKYDLPLHINPISGGGLSCDFNFAYQLADTPLLTIVHQDDYYHETYLEEMIRALNNVQKPLIAFSQAILMDERGNTYHSPILRIKHMLLMLLQCKQLQTNRMIRRMILHFGCPIICPSVLFHKQALADFSFDTSLHVTMDWDAWLRISKQKGSFVYLAKPLLYNRVHTQSTTSQSISDGIRRQEEYNLFIRLWPKPIAAFLANKYAKASNFYQKNK